MNAEKEMEIEIRLASVDDSASIAHVQISSYRAAYAPFFPRAYFEQMTEAEQTQDWRDFMNDANHEPLFVAANEAREIIGYALGSCEQKEIAGYDCELVAMHVLREHQRNGAGIHLFATMARDMKQRDKTTLMLWTLKENPVRAWYERLGGELVGEKSFDVDDVTVTEVAYGWKNIQELLERLNEN